MKALKWGYGSLIYLFLYLPIIIVVVFSFNSTYHSLLWHHFSLHWYHVLFQDDDIGLVTLHSLIVAVCAATLACILGSIIAIGFYRYNYAGRKILFSTILVLVIIPDLVMGIAFLVFFASTKIPLGFGSLLIAHISFCIPFVVITIISRLNQLNPGLIEASQDLGASDFTLYRRILLPLLIPAMISSWLLSFALSIDDVMISYFVTGPDYQILPLKIYSMVKLGVNPEINALSSLMLIVTLILVSIGYYVRKRKSCA